MTTRTLNERARDIELVADAITNAVKVALPAMVRREVQLQLARVGDLDEPQQAPAGKTGVAKQTSTDPGKT